MLVISPFVYILDLFCERLQRRSRLFQEGDGFAEVGGDLVRVGVGNNGRDIWRRHGCEPRR